MLTTIAAGRVFDFSHVVGRGGGSGMGFSRAVSLEGVLKISVTVSNVTSVKMSCADFQGIREIASLHEGPLKRKNVLISGISKHALRHRQERNTAQKARKVRVRHDKKEDMNRQGIVSASCRRTCVVSRRYALPLAYCRHGRRRRRTYEQVGRRENLQ